MTVPHSRFEHGHGRRHTLAAATTWFAPATAGTHRRQPLREEVCDAYATPRPPAPGERVRLRALTDVQVLDDGRVGATVVLCYPGIGLEKRFFFAFVRQDGRWRIDDIVGEITFSVP